MPHTVSDDRILALTTLLHHYRVVVYRKWKTSETETAIKFGVTQPELNNFLRQGAQGKKTGAAEKIAGSLWKIYCEDNWIDDAPDHIRQACYAAFPDDDDMVRLLRGDVRSVFADCAKMTPEAHWEAVDEVWAGVYDIFRYAARVIKKDEPKQVELPGGKIDYVSNALRAALQIYPRDTGQKFPRFELQYNPELKSAGHPPLTARGSVVIVDRYLYLIGRENSFYKPLFIVCKFNPAHVVDFNGLVVRHHDGGGEVFSSRAYFRKNDDVEGIDELKDELGVMSETDLPEDIKKLSHRFLNNTDFGGKGALLIQG